MERSEQTGKLGRSVVLRGSVFGCWVFSFRFFWKTLFAFVDFEWDSWRDTQCVWKGQATTLSSFCKRETQAEKFWRRVYASNISIAFLFLAEERKKKKPYRGSPTKAVLHLYCNIWRNIKKSIVRKNSSNSYRYIPHFLQCSYYGRLLTERREMMASLKTRCYYYACHFWLFSLRSKELSHSLWYMVLYFFVAIAVSGRAIQAKLFVPQFTCMHHLKLASFRIEVVWVWGKNLSTRLVVCGMSVARRGCYSCSLISETLI